MPRSSNKDRLDPAMRKLIWILILGPIAALLDVTIVNVAIESLTRELHTSVATIQWVNTGYMLAMGMVMPLSGWSVARFGGKRMWLVALALFLLGSMLSGAAWNVASLIAFRVVQGVGGGLMFPIQQTLLVQAAGRAQVGKLMATISLPAVVVPILGPVIGGFILSNLDWRWIFFVNAPICLVALALAWYGLAATEKTPGKPLDILGLGLLSPALVAILFGLSQAGHRGFDDAVVVVPLVIGVILLAGFAFHALRVRGEPIVDLRLFRKRSFAVSGIMFFLSGLGFYGSLLLLPLYYQQIRGLDALATGLMLVPQGIGALLARGPVGRMSDSIGPRPVVLSGVLLSTVGTVFFAFAGPNTSYVLLGAALILIGIGRGAAPVAVMAAAMQGLSRPEIPHASSATRIMQQIGGAFGTAVFAVILQRQLAGVAATEHATAFNNTFWWTIGFTVLSFIPALFYPRPARQEPTEPATPPANAPSTSKQVS